MRSPNTNPPRRGGSRPRPSKAWFPRSPSPPADCDIGATEERRHDLGVGGHVVGLALGDQRSRFETVRVVAHARDERHVVLHDDKRDSQLVAYGEETIAKRVRLL